MPSTISVYPIHFYSFVASRIRTRKTSLSILWITLPAPPGTGAGEMRSNSNLSTISLHMAMASSTILSKSLGKCLKEWMSSACSFPNTVNHKPSIPTSAFGIGTTIIGSKMFSHTPPQTKDQFYLCHSAFICCHLQHISLNQHNANLQRNRMVASIISSKRYPTMVRGNAENITTQPSISRKFCNSSNRQPNNYPFRKTAQQTFFINTTLASSLATINQASHPHALHLLSMKKEISKPHSPAYFTVRRFPIHNSRILSRLK